MKAEYDIRLSPNVLDEAYIATRITRDWSLDMPLIEWYTERRNDSTSKYHIQHPSRILELEQDYQLRKL